MAARFSALFSFRLQLRILILQTSDAGLDIGV
jgi:hypothetical protein